MAEKYGVADLAGVRETTSSLTVARTTLEVGEYGIGTAENGACSNFLENLSANENLGCKK